MLKFAMYNKTLLNIYVTRIIGKEDRILYEFKGWNP